MDLSFKTFSKDMPHQTILIVSHERSGTHFLMNSMGKAFGYHSDNWIDLDWHKVPINYFASQDITQLMSHFNGQKLANPIKSHHQADFFAPVIEKVLESVAILYIYRNPWDVMQSLCRLLNHCEWREGPICNTPSELMRTEPEGHLMRYQIKQYHSMLHRWKDHVSGWLELAKTNDKIVTLCYENLLSDYSSTLMKIAEQVVGMTPKDSIPPDKIHSVIGPEVTDVAKLPTSVEDKRYINEVSQDLNERIGYYF